MAKKPTEVTNKASVKSSKSKSPPKSKQYSSSKSKGAVLRKEVLNSKEIIDGFKHKVHRVQAEMSKLEKEAEDLRIKGEDKAADSIIRKGKILEGEMSELLEVVKDVPGASQLFGLEETEEIIRLEPSELIEAKNFNSKDFALKASQHIVPPQLTGYGPRNVNLIENDVITPQENIGKLRFKVTNESSQLARNAVFSVKAKSTTDGKEVVLKQGQTDAKGYASVNFTRVPRDAYSELKVEIGAADSQSKYVQALSLSEVALQHQLGSAHIFVIPKDKELDFPEIFTDQVGAEKPGTVEDPDDIDILVSPDSFGLNEEHVDGNCCLRPRTEFASAEYHFRQIVRVTDTDIVFDGKREVDRNKVTGPIPFGDEKESTYSVTGGNLVLGFANLYKQGWYPVGQGLGKLLYSTSLAPCEDINITVIDWQRSERDSRVEQTTSREKLAHELNHDRSIDEVVDAVLTEKQSGSSASGGGGASLDLGIFSIGGGGGKTSSNTSGRRDLHTSTVQDISDTVTQKASAFRSQRSTVVTTSRQRESERINTRNIHNHNKNHVMNLMYSAVVSHYAVKTELVEEKPVVLVPYEIDDDIFDKIPSFDKFVKAPSRPITRFLDRYSRKLRRMVPRKYRRAFNSLSRLLHCSDVYDIEQPFATFSRWRVDLDRSWRKGISLSIETDSGQSVTLEPRGAIGKSGPVDFVSLPVRADDLKELRVSFDPAESAQSIDFGPFSMGGDFLNDLLAQSTKHKLERVEITTRTDRSRFVPTPQSFRLNVGAVNTTLDNENPFVMIPISDVEVNFENYRGREHRDYCRLQELIAHIQSHPMRYMRAIWLREDPDRRAIRFDQYEMNGESLLDNIVNRPVGVLGNYVAFELLEGHRFIQVEPPEFVVSSRVVTMPTRGIFGEVYLSCCNATEKRDVERFIDPEQACAKNAPAITGITPGTRASRGNTTPTPLAAPIVNLQNVPGLPDPTGMTAALNTLSTPDIFRDLSRGAELLQFIDSATKEAFTSTRQHRAAMNAIAGDVVRGLVSAYTGVPIPSSGGKGGSGAKPGTTGIKSTPSGSGGKGANTSAAGSSDPTQAVVSEMVRSTNPAQLRDHLQTIQKAVESGALTQSQGNAASNALVGGANIPAGDDPNAITAVLTRPANRDQLTFGAIAGNKTGQIQMEATVDSMPEGAKVEWSCANPGAVAFSAKNSMVTDVSALIPGKHLIQFKVFDSANNQLGSSMDIPIVIPQFIFVNEDSAQFDNALSNYGLTADKDKVVTAIKATAEQLLSTSNVRMIWQVGAQNETLPAQYSGAGVAADKISVATLKDEDPTDETYGITIPVGGAFGPTVFNESIEIYSGEYDDPVVSILDDAVNQLVSKIASLGSPDARLNSLLIDLVGRLIGETLAHEIIHSMIGKVINPNGTRTNHHSPHIAAGCIMNPGSKRNLKARTGIEITDLPNFPDVGSYTDHGAGIINVMVASVQAQMDDNFPIVI
ncbi:hypothetical protein [Kangiella sp. HZ709]|uniref:hypothetical protein n=1 Tax=Kangiella sp. HZ709 TaxID=2666328 RepID=UPI0012B146B0|nr:hypothetical protein [Kangiella sp. HZ709]MRX27806.1 hypothetical protein [Kangiella sp. HZ709]